MNKYLSVLGYQGPNILLGLILISLYYYKPQTPLLVYAGVCLWQFASHILNVVIKNSLVLPRPDSKPEEFEKLANNITWKNYLIIHRNFGMPSGHAQAVISQLVFIILFFQKPLLSAIAAGQSALTLYQRYAARRHSTDQLFAGSLLGIVVGIGFYYIMIHYPSPRLH